MPINLRRMGNRTWEERAGFIVLRTLHDEGMRVDKIWRPDEQTPRPPGRLVDFVADVDGAPVAVEVVRYGVPPEDVNTRQRVAQFKTHLSDRLLERFGTDHGSTIFVHLKYDAPAVLRLRRNTLPAAAVQLADAYADALETAEMHHWVDVRLAADWLVEAEAMRELAGLRT